MADSPPPEGAGPDPDASGGGIAGVGVSSGGGPGARGGRARSHAAKCRAPTRPRSAAADRVPASQRSCSARSPAPSHPQAAARRQHRTRSRSALRWSRSLVRRSGAHRSGAQRLAFCTLRSQRAQPPTILQLQPDLHRLASLYTPSRDRPHETGTEYKQDRNPPRRPRRVRVCVQGRRPPQPPLCRDQDHHAHRLGPSGGPQAAEHKPDISTPLSMLLSNSTECT